jgi:glycosyltransferase involved in cell wall biosynthesis
MGLKVLQISCNYFPESVGGTEVYVRNLSKELLLQGNQVFISYVSGFSQNNGPLIKKKEYSFEGVPVFVIQKNNFKLKTKDLYFNTDRYPEIYTTFKEYLKRVHPDVVHFHHFSPTDVIIQMQAVKDMGLPIILTYHTPMMTCSHSDMLYLGKKPCDGKIDYKRCLICMQTKYRVPLCFAWVWANLPKSITNLSGRSVSNNMYGRFATWLQLPWFTGERIKRWEEGFKMIDHFVAVCQWVYDLLIENDIPQKKTTLCRQGIGQIPAVTKREKGSALRLGYLGRIHPVKGIDMLLKAFRLLPRHYQIGLYIYGLPGGNNSDRKYYNNLVRQTRREKRIKWLGILEEKDKFQILGQLDVLIIPSIWLETGPLVLLESWAVHTPVLGARIGGIAELVEEGKGGLLFKPGDPSDLLRIIKNIYKEPDILERLRMSIPEVPTMKEVTKDMEDLYKWLINKSNGVTPTSPGFK